MRKRQERNKRGGERERRRWGGGGGGVEKMWSTGMVFSHTTCGRLVHVSTNSLMASRFTAAMQTLGINSIR